MPDTPDPMWAHSLSSVPKRRVKVGINNAYCWWNFHAFPTTVLPLPRDDTFSDQPRLQQAYERLCTYESRLSVSANNPLPARWLGHLLREVPVKGILAREITSCKDDSALGKLSTFYRDRLLRVCEYTPNYIGSPLTCTSVQVAGGPTPAPSDHPSRPSVDVMQELNAVLPENYVPHDHGEAKRLVQQSFPILWPMLI